MTSVLRTDEYCWHFVPRFKSILEQAVWLYTSFLVTFEWVFKTPMAGASRATKHLKPPSSFGLRVFSLIKGYSHAFTADLTYECKIYSYNEHEKCIMCSLLLPNSFRKAMLGPLWLQRIQLYQLIIFTFLKILWPWFFILFKYICVLLSMASWNIVLPTPSLSSLLTDPGSCKLGSGSLSHG